MELWLCMKKHQNRKFPLSSDLDPAKSLPEFPGKSDVLKWEAALKASLQRWMRDLESPFSKVQEEFRTKFEKPKNGSLRVAGATSDHPDGIATTFHVPSNSTPESHTYSTALALLSDLQKLGALPALLFNYDRSGCEQLVNMLNYQLFQAEKNWKEKSSEWKKTMEHYNNWKKAQSKVKSRPAVTKKSAKGGDSDGMSKMDQIREEASRQSSPWEKFRERDPLARFSFADEKNVSRSELEERIRSLPQDKVPRRIIDALRRGIGIHHAGMNREYRQV